MCQTHLCGWIMCFLDPFSQMCSVNIILLPLYLNKKVFLEQGSHTRGISRQMHTDRFTAFDRYSKTEGWFIKRNGSSHGGEDLLGAETKASRCCMGLLALQARREEILSHFFTPWPEWNGRRSNHVSRLIILGPTASYALLLHVCIVYFTSAYALTVVIARNWIRNKHTF